MKTMKRVRIYEPGSYGPGEILELSPTAAQHVSTVLRMRPGEELILFSGDNREFPSIITVVQKKKVFVMIQSVYAKDCESPRAIHLAQAVSKGDRMEWIVQKAVELGISTITPLITERCVVRLDQERSFKKQQQWQAIAVAACEQSGRNWIPHILPFTPLRHYLHECTSPIRLTLDPDAECSLREYVFGSGEISLLIGPEGGLTKDEIHQTQAQRFQALRMGPRILRTETAAISALSILQASVGDL
jgi:16S rRNA (uracil1498-N3)-methyltransferase